MARASWPIPAPVPTTPRPRFVRSWRRARPGRRDIDRVAVGAPLIVRASAFPGRDFTGKVSEIGCRMGRKTVRTEASERAVVEAGIAWPAGD